MSEIVATYQPRQNTVPAGPPQFVDPPLSPRTRALVVGVVRVLYLAIDVLQEYADLPRRNKQA